LDEKRKGPGNQGFFFGRKPPEDDLEAIIELMSEPKESLALEEAGKIV